jgi:GT2 family glycosyltransferase
MEEKISVILVNYNGMSFNDACIQSILKSRIRDSLEIIVVDNASTDGSLEALQKVWGDQEKVHIIALDDNYGFAKANNIGIRWAMEQGCSTYVLLNNDTEIKEDTLERLLKCSQEHKALVVPKVLYADRPGVIWYAGGNLTPVIWKPVHRGLNQKDTGQYDREEKCDFANGCCLLMTKEIIEKIGYLDERFFLYYEDTEYSLRARAAGVEIWYCGQAVVYHKVNGATKGNENPLSVYYITRNWLLCNRQHMKTRFIIFRIYFFFNRLAWGIIWKVQGKNLMICEIKHGIRHYKEGKNGRCEQEV